MQSNTAPGRTTAVAVVSVFSYLSLSNTALVIFIFTLLGIFELAAICFFRTPATRRKEGGE